MTEQEWLTSDDAPDVMSALRGKISERKAALFDVVCARSLEKWWVNSLAERKVLLAERIADGEELDDNEYDAVCDELSTHSRTLWNEAVAAFQRSRPGESALVHEAIYRYLAATLADGLQASLEWWYWLPECDFTPTPTRADQLGENLHLETLGRNLPLLRCIVGNPFRPVPFKPTWHTSTIVTLAKQMYDSRDFAAMPILADALQDAGCDNKEMLEHCRDTGPHARGCWVVDLVLGKS